MATNHVVLLGAGFSRNWDAPLAAELTNWVLGRIGDDPYLRSVLSRHEKDFESALSQVQMEYTSSPTSPEAKARLDRMQDAVAAVFEASNAALQKGRFEFSQERRFSVSEFLARFDAIFGLNQDLLLELHYGEQVLLANPNRWGGLQWPGMRPVRDPQRGTRTWAPAPPFTVHSRLQPYFKLHGSSDWHTDDGRDLLVMGGNKQFNIRQFPVLRWYYDQFKSYLSRPDTRLMVIGYSFSDEHINDAIIEARRSGGLTGMFLVDPAGRDVLNAKGGSPVSRREGLEEIPSLGGSTRLISATFAGDEFEHGKFVEFFRRSSPL